MKSSTLLLIVLCLWGHFAFANGILFLSPDSSQYLPILKSEVQVTVNQQIATITTTHTFHNNTGLDTTFTYGFPTPVGASATALKWYVNNTWHISSFNGSPQDSSLVFDGGSTSYQLAQYLGANAVWAPIEQSLAADSVMIVSLTYVQLLPYSLNTVSFSYPNDYSDLFNNTIDSQSFVLNLQSQRTITNLQLSSHAGAAIQLNPNSAQLSYTLNNQVADLDYELFFELDPDELGIFSYSTWLDGGLNHCDSLGEGFFALIIEPESGDSVQAIGKDFVLVLDRSGSMGGSKITQAVEATRFIINNLNLGDRFNIVDFSSAASAFSSQLEDNTPSNRLSALQYLDAVSAGGGTNFGDALNLALPFLGTSDSSRAQIVMFLTDGQGSPSGQDLLNLVANLRGQYAPNLNFFSIGIGASTNVTDLTQVAQQNNGFPIFLANGGDLNQALSNFYLSIQNPVLLNPSIDFAPAITEEVFPTYLPNLYAGQQLILIGRYVVPDSVAVTLSGNLNAQPISYQYDIELTDSLIYEHLFLYKLWAKSKIDQLYAEFLQEANGSPTAIAIQTQITDLGSCYGIVSPFTSFSGGGGGTGGGTGGGVSTSVELEYDAPSTELKINAFPNPFGERLSIAWPTTSPPEQPLLLNIYDFKGQLILQHSWNPQNLFEWDGKNAQQESLPAGVYFIRFDWEGQQFETKVIKR